MYFIGRDEDDITRFDRVPAAIPINLTFSGMNEHLMFPIMRMLRSMSARKNLRNPHKKMVRPLLFTDNHAGCYPFGILTIKVIGFDLGILLNPHVTLGENGPLQFTNHNILIVSSIYYPLHGLR